MLRKLAAVLKPKAIRAGRIFVTETAKGWKARREARK